MAMIATLIVEEGPDKGRRFTCDQVQFKVGRSANSADFVISDQDTAVSRTHFAIIRRGDTFLFNNLARNGSTINGVRVDQALLNSNDLIKIGAVTVLRFVLEDNHNAEINPSY